MTIIPKKQKKRRRRKLEKNSTVKKLWSNLSVAVFAIAIIVLVVYLITILSSSRDYFRDSAEKNALINFEKDIANTNLLADAHYDNLYAIADRLQYASSRNEVNEIMASYVGSAQFGDLRYYSQGQSYSVYGAEISQEMHADAQIRELSKSKTEGCTEVYEDSYVKMSCIAFFVPVRGSAYVDGVLSIVPARNIISFDGFLQEKNNLIALIDASGRIYAESADTNTEITTGNNFYDYVDRVTHNKNDANAINEAIISGESGALTIGVGAVNYTITFTPVEKFGNHLWLVTVSESEGLIAPEHTYVRHVVSLLLVSIAALCVGGIYALLYRKKSKEAIAAATLTDAALDCPNGESFRRRVQQKIVNTRQKYSIVVFSIHNYLYINEQLGEEKSLELLSFLAKIFDNFLAEDECFGFLGDGRFAMLVNNVSNHTLKDRIHIVEKVSARNEMLLSRRIKLTYDVGVYNIFENRNRTVYQMMECAGTAADHNANNVGQLYSLFTEEVSRDIAHNERIEMMMENALSNREFRVFVQPKYNVAHDKIDSVEALVRWFDPNRGEYMFPAEFIPLFESNGFITKLDHYVYLEVLEFISQSAERGDKVVPVAVNVSRVTAGSEDFINFYVGNKKKYRIPDGFITLEITESFAMEDNDKIAYIIDELHKNGMRCSIDDFGSGYSSFNILKRMKVDELKLDAVFAESSGDENRDDKILSSMIDLAKSMNMVVVQEGVESEKVFNKVVSMGIDVVQGYYYAKAITLEEFKIFVNSNTSIKYKSKVK
jgi:EAL domain-containing protein (putative c-di-GMP-specific phosphodiesterase class I)